MSRTRAHRLIAAANFPSELAAPVVQYEGTPVNATVGANSTLGTQLPPGAKVVELRMTDSIYIRFGHSDVGAAAADTNSELVLAGEKILVLPLVGDAIATFFRAIRVGSADVALQIKKVATE